MAVDSGGHTDVVRAPVEKILEALLDFDHYPEWQASMLECSVKERDAAGRPSLVEFYVDAKIRKVRYISRYTYDLPDGFSWDQVSGDLKENSGRYTFVPRADGRTDVTIGITFAVGFYVPGPMKNLIRDQALKTSLRDLNKRVAV